MFKMGIKSGKGTYYYRNGNVYKGNYDNNYIQGYGILDGNKGFY